MTMNVSFDGGWNAVVAGTPLDLIPRFLGGSVIVFPDRNNEERQKFLAETFGSQERLWDAPDFFRFDRDNRQLVGAQFAWPEECASPEESARLHAALPAVRPGGLRAEKAEDFRHERCTVLCRAPRDAALTCLRDLAVLDEPFEARIGIAPDVTLLVQSGAVVGWSLTDPARYMSTPFDTPDSGPPSTSTRHLLTECLDLVTTPGVDDVVDGEPAALARLLAADAALGAQREDRHRADALRELIATYVRDYGNG